MVNKLDDIRDFSGDSIYNLFDRDINIESIMVDQADIYNYIEDIVVDRLAEVEPIIMVDPYYAYYYARRVLKRRWREAEPVIMVDPDSAYYYACNVIKGRWAKAESIIMMDKHWWSQYCGYFKIDQR